ncbi:MAG: MBL fold metallo-hydrolase [Gammaproteobacteria bacterium]|nr:MBL fold metallo-hydrolase [Gammaproteobacteria bacterium]NNC56487.1 MBL fold metallo-hydrolase [Woeseiaceae bacterium]NNL51613.1 MBL fold metallo-hydrolase [Woeseiaceae bacterium]
MSEIEYEFDTRPEQGETMAISDSVVWLRMPLPFSLRHINLWLLRDEASWVIVDTGVDTKTSRDVWRDVFASTMGGDPASHVVATHLHPDHIGCAGWLVTHFDVDLWMTRDEYMLCRILAADTGRSAPDEGIHFYKAAGYTAEQLDSYKSRFGMFGKFVHTLPEAYKRMADGNVLDFGGIDWEVIVGSGHSPEHACLYDAERNLLIAGDQLLPTISSNVSVWPTEPLANPLKDWFASLEKLEKRLPADVLVLPAHGKPFRGAHYRLRQLAKEHEDRLDALLDICSKPMRVVDLFPSLYKTTIDDNNRIMATGEAISHLNYLCERGDMTAETGSDDVTRYCRN